jgi:carbon-monoxide dehydrogenase large subunit
VSDTKTSAVPEPLGGPLGVALPRREDADLLTGRARTVADLRAEQIAELVELPEPAGGSGRGPAPDHRPLEAAFVRSPVAHAVLVGVDVGAAGSVPGVVGAWSAAQLPDLPVTPLPTAAGDRLAGRDWPALAIGRIRYAGQPIAVVVGVTRAEAEDGAAAVRCDLDPLPPVPDLAAALAPDAPQLFPGRSNLLGEQDFGDPAEHLERVFDSAASSDDVIVVRGVFRQRRVLPASLEGRALLAAPTSSGGLTVWASHQAQHTLRDALAEAFGLRPEQVRVLVPVTGGAFGAKSQVYPEYLAVARLALLLGRPVRWVEDRSEALLAAPRGRGQEQRTALAATRSGRFLAYRLEIDADLGAYPHPGAGVAELTAQLAPGAYRTPLVHAHLRSVLTSCAPACAYRGAGRPEAAFAIERTVDLMARRLGLDPAELRRRNHVPAGAFPYRTRTGFSYDSGAYTAALDLALAEVDQQAVRAEQAERLRTGAAPIGLGVASYVERSGGPPDGDEHGAVEVGPDGGVIARVGSTSTGQGHRTAFAQLVAGALGLPTSAVRVVQNDTAAVPYGHGTFGSRSMQVGGAALWQAAGGLVDRGRELLAAECGCPVDRIGYAGGRFRCGHGERSLADLAAAAGGSLRVDRRPTVAQAFPFGAYAAVVEIDPDLGTVTVRRLVAVDDCGVVVNPLIVDGQRHGSIAQGIGQALVEQAYGDDAGVPAARSLLDHLLPGTSDLPPVTLRRTRTPNPNVPHGAKGAAEAGCIGAPPAVVNAVCDALDVNHVDMPLTPEALWDALRRTRPPTGSPGRPGERPPGGAEGRRAQRPGFR